MNNKGFTIVEMIIVFLISTLLMTGGYASFREFSKRQSIDAAEKKIISDLRFSQSSSTSGVKPAGCITLLGYRMRFTSLSGPPTYTITAECQNGAATIVYPVKTETLSNYITLRATNFLGSDRSVLYRPLGLGTSLTRDAFIDITDTRFGGNAQSITLGQGGQIK